LGVEEAIATTPAKGKRKGAMAMDKDTALLSDLVLLLVTATETAPPEGY